MQLWGVPCSNHQTWSVLVNGMTGTHIPPSQCFNKIDWGLLSIGLYAGTKKRALPKGSRTKTFDALREKAASALQAATK